MIEEPRIAPANEAAGACITNIGPRERRRRLRFGVVLLVAGAALAVLLIGIDVHRLWRFLLFLPFWAGAAGVLQAREKT